MKSYRERLEALIETAIDMLDEIDGDCDCEDDGIAEPWLGWTKIGAIGNRLDFEENVHAA